MENSSFKCNVGGVERLGSLAVGGLLLLRGLVRRRALSTALGGLFVYRGLSGNCMCYQLLEVDTRSEEEKSA